MRLSESTKFLLKVNRQEKQPWRLYESRYARYLLRNSRKEYKCAGCGQGIKLTADHIKPIKEGGKTELQNLQWLCDGCHRAKTEEEQGWEESKGEQLEDHAFDDGG